MSETSKKLNWDEADTDAENNMLFQIPEGTTLVEPLFAQAVETSRFEGKYIIFCNIDGHLRRISIGAKMLRKMKAGKDAGITKFAITRVGLDMTSRFTVQEQLPVKKGK